MDWQRVIRRLGGQVQFETEGGLPGKFLTLAAKEHIPLWDTHRSEQHFSACCKASQYRLLRPLARRSGLRLRIVQKAGPVFFLRKYHARPGLAAGALIYIFLLTWLCGRIWSLDIRGITYMDEAVLREKLAEHGVAVGRPVSAVSPRDIQLDAMATLPDVAWLAVNLNGCVAEIELTEMRKDDAPIESCEPSNLIAAHDGIVVAVQITEGEATVKVGDAVAKGSLLASGVTSTDTAALVRRSAGEVIAQTEHTLCVSVPLTETLPLPTERAYESLHLHLFGVSLPLFCNGSVRENCLTERFEKMLTVGDTVLPLGITMERTTVLAPRQVVRNRADALALANERLKGEEKALSNAQILSWRTEEALQGGVLTLTGHYQCIENIAVEVPLQIADTDKQ